MKIRLTFSRIVNDPPDPGSRGFSNALIFAGYFYTDKEKYFLKSLPFKSDSNLNVFHMFVLTWEQKLILKTKYYSIL